jgi:hypothetical protein
VAAALRKWLAIAMQNTAALTRERRNGRTAAGAAPQGLSPQQLFWAVVTGELFAAVALFASGNVPPILVRSLQIFLRF